ncbi:hypothetical protein L218DRAFT_1006027 [Marasmius fiardii PR-910]|nr:hypothetical protein L218DRAFT_1006027 [Marasmius fiardii PR-910]
MVIGMEIMSLPETVSRVTLLLSAFLFTRPSSPPVRSPNLPPVPPSLAEKREWLFIALLYMLYWVVTLLECLSIALKYFDDPNWNVTLTEYVLLPPHTSKSPGSIAILLLLIGIAGGFFRIWSFITLGKSFTFDVTKPRDS